MVDPGIDARKQWFALTVQQRRNVRQRLASMREKMPRQLFLLAIQEVMRLELTPGRPDPYPCPAQVQPAIGPMMRDMLRDTCSQAPYPKP